LPSPVAVFQPQCSSADPHPQKAPRFNPDRSYTIDISGHGLKAIRHIDASRSFDKHMIALKGLKMRRPDRRVAVAGMDGIESLWMTLTSRFLPRDLVHRDGSTVRRTQDPFKAVDPNLRQLEPVRAPAAAAPRAPLGRIDHGVQKEQGFVSRQPNRHVIAQAVVEA
jgi:hypothetical protein